jgi:hypothetical protein
MHAAINILEIDSELLSNQATSGLSEDLSILMNEVDATSNPDLARKISILIQTLGNSALKMDEQVVEEIRALAQTHNDLVKKVSSLVNETPEIVI